MLGCGGLLHFRHSRYQNLDFAVNSSQHFIGERIYLSHKLSLAFSFNAADLCFRNRSSFYYRIRYLRIFDRVFSFE